MDQPWMHICPPILNPSTKLKSVFFQFPWFMGKQQNQDNNPKGQTGYWEGDSDLPKLNIFEDLLIMESRSVEKAS